MIPLISVIIPSANRPQLLARAVDSALAIMPARDLEVIVVPNGSDSSWLVSLHRYFNNKSVRVLPVDTPNANVARNQGMRHAKGKYIRFLDDDDVLFAEGCSLQLQLAEHIQADVCSAPIDLIDSRGGNFGVALQPDTPDFVAAAMSSRRMLQCTAHLFRTDSVSTTVWNERLIYSQDIEWVLRLCGPRDLIWAKTDIPCGAWSRRIAHRVSTSAPLYQRKRVVAEGILKLVDVLKRSARLTEHRRNEAAAGLWGCIRAAMVFAPRYWADIAAVANDLSPGSCPPGAVHRSWLSAAGVSPLAIERMLLPKRFTEYVWRRLARDVGILRYW